MNEDLAHAEAGELIVLHKLLDRVPRKTLDAITAECMEEVAKFEDPEDPECNAYLQAVAFVAARVYEKDHPEKFGT